MITRTRTAFALTAATRIRLFSTTASRLSLSHVQGPSEPPVSNHTIGSLLKQTTSKYGSLPAVISMHQGKTLTYNDLDELSSNLAANLARKTKVQKGDNIAVCCGNRWEFLVIQMGLGKLGAVMIPLNPGFTNEQFQAALNHCQAKVLITQDKLEKRNGNFRQFDDLIGFGNAPESTIQDVFVIGDQSFNSMITTPSSAPITTTATTQASGPPTATMCDEIINMQFTSGTTSAPKLAALTHANIVNNGIFIGNRMGLTATKSQHPTGQDHLCIPVPMFHCFGLVLANLAAVSHGCALVYPSESFDPVKSLQAVREFSCTGLYGVPTMFAQQLELHEEISKGGLQYLSKGIAAGSSIPIEMMKKLISVFNLHELTICYGMTETSPVSFMTSPQDALDKRTSTVGKIMPNTEAMIVNPAQNGTNDGDPEYLEPVPRGTRGEIVVAGYLLQREYYNDPENTQKAMTVDITGKKWMKTGDEGVMDPDGYVSVTGRIKDLIIRGGENIHPLEIENVLFQHPSVSQASVVGAPCDKYGESIVAFIVPHNDTVIEVTELQQFVRDKIGPFMTPEHVEFVSDFPKTASGKIRKVELRDMVLAKLSK